MINNNKYLDTRSNIYTISSFNCNSTFNVQYTIHATIIGLNEQSGFSHTIRSLICLFHCTFLNIELTSVNQDSIYVPSYLTKNKMKIDREFSDTSKRIYTNQIKRSICSHRDKQSIVDKQGATIYQNDSLCAFNEQKAAGLDE